MAVPPGRVWGGGEGLGWGGGTGVAGEGQSSPNNGTPELERVPPNKGTPELERTATLKVEGQISGRHLSRCKPDIQGIKTEANFFH